MTFRVILSAFVHLSLLISLGCEKRGDSEAHSQTEKAPLPYERIRAGGADPAVNGPDDSILLKGTKGVVGEVVFPHFSHASNGKDGSSIPCQRCHHKTSKGEYPRGGCLECHPIPAEDADPANRGPEDNLVLVGTLNKAEPIPFNHFTHASGAGYKIACDSCHHTGDNAACTSCHKPLPGRNEDGAFTSRSKRVFHLQCKGCHKALKKSEPDTKAPTTCKECHRARRFVTPKEGLSRNRAFHIQCIGCHEATRLNPAIKRPPTDCDGCHSKFQRRAEPTFAELAKELSKEMSEKELVRDPELEKNKGPERIVIDHAKTAKSGTPFGHRTHQELRNDCYTCHHKGLKDPTCRSCHNNTASAQNAYHRLCISCHRKNNIPAKCLDCHP